MVFQGAKIARELHEDAEREARIAKSAAQTAVVTKFWFYHPAERKAQARDALRQVIESSFRRDAEDGMIDVHLEALWNIMAGNNER